ncbi:MAG: helix-turn-helix domain-containing protein [Actinomycetota bacterium]|nr:helix-turn-helix domain-containing protein [Actinomycetota bacterium]
MDDLWDITRVAEYLGVSERTVYNRVRAGELPAIKIGRLWRVRAGDLQSWLGAPSAHTTGPYPYASEREPLSVVREAGARPDRVRLEALLAPLADPLARRLAFVGLLSFACEGLGWPAPVVVGGNAVEFYTAGDYATADIDLAGASEPIAQVLGEWGFEREGRHFYDQELNLVLEVPGGRLAPEQLAHAAAVRIAGVTAYVLGIEDLIVDRLAACVFWKDEESCVWARVMLTGEYDIDRQYLEERAAAEDVLDMLRELESRS